MEDTETKEREISAGLHQSLKHIFDSPITEAMRVVQGNSKQAGVISFAGRAGDWFQPRTSADFSISLGREISDTSIVVAPSSNTASRKIISIDKLLDKGEKTLRRNGS